MRKKSGTSIVELLVSVFLLTVFGAALYGVYQMAFHIHDVAIGQNAAAALSRNAVDTMADHLRNAHLNTNTSSGVLDSAIHAAAESDVTYYVSDTTAETVRYRLNGTNLERTDTSGTVVSGANIQSLSLTYYKSNSYNGTWTQTTDPHAPTSSELKYIAGILIEATVAKDGYSTKYTSMVRLRNSPKKSRLSGI